MKRVLTLTLLLLACPGFLPLAVADWDSSGAGSAAPVGNRVPGKTWSRYADPAKAGWSMAKLAEARAFWESLDSAAWMVVENGVVVVAWGDCERRYMCHSVRKSLLSGLYGVHVDGGTVDTEKTLAQLGIDDEPKLTEMEQRARIEDLLRARSGVYKLAAYEPPQNPKPDRGTHEPGTHWCYNNFDFNTLGTIFEQETGTKIFEEFGARFAQPLGMQDYRARDGYYHYELDKSIHPAYPFRLSARDCVRYGLLFLNGGMWDGEQILSQAWIDRSTASYSDTGSPGGGYGYMWWTFDNADTPGLTGYTARGVGGQTIAVLPEAGLVVVNRTDTYMGHNVGSRENMQLMGMILAARSGSAGSDPALVAMESASTATPKLDAAQVARYVGTYEPGGVTVTVRAEDDVLLYDLDQRGVFGLLPVAGSDGIFLVEDRELHISVSKPAKGRSGTMVSELTLVREFDAHLEQRAFERAQAVAEQALETFPMSPMAHVMLGRAFQATGDPTLARSLVEAAFELDPEHGEARVLARSLVR